MSLARADERCESAPVFTADELTRMRAVKLDDGVRFQRWMKKRKGQGAKDAADERNLWCWEWYQDVRRMEHDFNGG